MQDAVSEWEGKQNDLATALPTASGARPASAGKSNRRQAFKLTLHLTRRAPAVVATNAHVAVIQVQPGGARGLQAGQAGKGWRVRSWVGKPGRGQLNTSIAAGGRHAAIY